MYKSTSAARQLQSGINVGRRRLAQQFSTMEGWQAQQSDRFDQYVKEKRQKEYYDAFDQRVERAYRTSAKAHKTEVINAFKRRLTSKQEKFSPAVMLEMKTAVEDRLRWLREVWAQVDADYRSSSSERQAQAAREISATLRGEPGEYMKFVYEKKLEDRFAGPKGQAEAAATFEGADLPEVSDDEANRYHHLKLDMTEIERSVKERFGLAGQQHWAELQAAKDAVYEEKLDQAAAVYQQLLDQSQRHDESRRTALLRSNVERVHQAQVRFQAAMELEQEREAMVEAHQKMEEERKAAAKEVRRARLQEAAELRASGATSEEVRLQLRQRQLDRHAEAQAEYQLRERQAVETTQQRYLHMIEQLKSNFEEHDGLELMAQPAAATAAGTGRSPNVFGFYDDDALDGADRNSSSSSALAAAAAATSEAHTMAAAAAASSPATAALRASALQTKRDLWKSIASDVYEDPFHTVHQARLDAAKTYDPLYARHTPLALRQGRKYTRQGTGEYAAGNAMDNQVFQKGNDIAPAFQWGLNPGTVHAIDGDGSTDYMFQGQWHVRDKETGDIDWRYEKKGGGPIFRGPKFYRMGAAREAADPSEAPIDPSPQLIREQRRLQQGQRAMAPSSSSSSSPRNNNNQSKKKKGVQWRSR